MCEPVEADKLKVPLKLDGLVDGVSRLLHPLSSTAGVDVDSVSR